ncbi:MAG: hypothetical protein ACLTSP_10025 [Coprococcus sp.]
MDTRRVLYLINMLKDGSSGKQEKLAELYDRSLQESDEYQQLCSILDSYSFVGSAGTSIQEHGNDLIHKMTEEPENIIQILRETQQLNELISSEIRHNEQLMDYPGAFTEEIHVVPKVNLDAYNQFLVSVAAACTYIIAVENGYGGLESLSWSENYNFTEKLSSVNTAYIPTLLELKYNTPPWMIYRRPASNNFVFSPYEYVLRYITTDELNKWILAEEYIEISPFLYGSPRRAGDTDLGIPIYLGIGNVISTKPLESLRLLQTGVGFRMAHPGGSMFLKRVPFLPEMLNRLASGSACIVEPEELTSVMNQWDAGYYINSNIQNHKCIICGEKLLGNDQVCRYHLGIRR